MVVCCEAAAVNFHLGTMQGDLLSVLFKSGLFDDEKTLVDMPLLAFPGKQLLTCRQSELEDAAFLRRFIEEHLAPAGSDLRPVAPPDFSPEPAGFLPRVPHSSDWRDWALQVHRLWPSLCVACSPEVAEEPARHSLLHVPHHFFIPGDRFREMYYWDSYWIVRGLVASRMLESAWAVVLNLLHLLRRHGLVPNGSRSYYLNRSQPPLLSETLRVLCMAEMEGGSERGRNCLELIREALPLLIAEHQFWTSTPRALRVRDPRTGMVHTLSRYYALWDKPRPEAHCKDCAVVEREYTGGASGEEKAALFREFAMVAESGWDFSSRWMRCAPALSSCQATRILPADLNAILFQMERNIAFFAHTLHCHTPQGQDHEEVAAAASSEAAGGRGGGEGGAQLGYMAVARRFEAAADARRCAMEALMWREEGRADGAHAGGECGVRGRDCEGAGRRDSWGAVPAGARWTDVWITRITAGALDDDDGVWEVEKRPWAPLGSTELLEGGTGADGAGHPVYASDFLPLWCGLLPPGDAQVDLVVAAFESSGLLLPGGVAASTVHTGEQWDFPNAWPPLQHALCEAFAVAGTPRSRAVAAAIHARFLAAARQGWEETGAMHEKYDGMRCGGVGAGGEYKPQVGFGWTNGAVLALLSSFGCPSELQDSSFAGPKLQPSRL